MKNLLYVALLILSSLTVNAQWANPGISTTGFNPTISKSNPQFTIRNTLTNSQTSIIYRVSNANEVYLTHHDNINEFTIGNSPTASSNAFGMNPLSGNARLKGRLNFNGTANTKIQAEGKQMLWYDDDTGLASWGFNATRNRFGKPINIGSELTPTATQALVIADAKNIAMVGNNAYINWFAASRSNHTGSSAGFVGVNQFGSLFMESNLDKVNIDGETGINLLASDVIRARMSENGNWAFGSTLVDPMYRICIQGDVKINGELFTTSDFRMKKNIHSINSGIATVMALNPVTYEYKSEEFESLANQTNAQLGFIAQEVESILPQLVSTSEDTDVHGNTIDAKALNYTQLIPVLTKAIQEQQLLIESQAELLKELTAKLEAIEK